MSGKFIVKVCTVIEVGCIIGLAGLGLKRNNDWYKAEMKLIDTECELFKTKIEGILKDAQIKHLEKELSELKEKHGIDEEES